MNKKNRKLALSKLVKDAFVDSTKTNGLDIVLSDPSLQNIQDPQEFAHQLFMKMLAQINNEMKEIADKALADTK